ncbi:MAG: NUDIX hydrolase [Proteobacteria bacterium]|nr:NUDIX hydrolase [Desulfobacterales bacterium]MBL7101416.1 NUDIX hydrolase [Desulfobacteraceae bacterium]MBL7171537.1 NUDIX hydrolase [Desulfobacteraceae bacterium]MBU0735726.1 NUDIX hydrolase [Pseudomonadota bacterium]MBU1902525.1 NUDIX hydrolase [Pseudomonadota bacterium]
MTESTVTPAVPVRASTVILIRDNSDQLQVYLLKRSSRSGFMPGNYVFPGGTVDPGDIGLDFWKRYVDMDPGEVKRRFCGGLDIEDAMAHGIAAIRETFEEACLLLAGHTGKAGNDLEKLQEPRSNGTLPGEWLRELVLSGDWRLTLSALAPWSHWITPKARSRRYDTRFFMACMPEGQECRPDNSETTHGVWINPEKGLAGNLKGEIPLSPPALTTLHELLGYTGIGDLKEEMKTRPWGEASIPRLVRMAEAAFLLLPWDPHYRDQEIKADVKGLEKRPAPLGKPFSRLWYSQGIWRPLTP